MRPAWPDRCSQSKARGRICAPTRPGPSALDRSEFSRATRSFSIARSTIALRRLHKTRRAELIDTVLHLVRANRAPPENEAGLWFDPVKADRCVQSRQA